MQQPIILAFDTSGPWVETAVLRDGEIVAAQRVDMAKGQAEHLMPMVQQTLEQAQTQLQDVVAIGVGVGPGNFTGIRISVSAARGMALALGIPAIGVSLLDSLAYDGPRPLLACISAPRGTKYFQRFGDGVERPPTLVDTDGFSDWACPDLTIIGQDSAELSELLGAAQAPAAFAPASAIARIAAKRLPLQNARPAPLYIKPADAAPSREQGPTML